MRIATVLSQRMLALGAPRRASASSITSSWYSVARCTSSIETDPGISRGSRGVAEVAGQQHEHRAEALAARGDQVRRRLGEQARTTRRARTSPAPARPGRGARGSRPRGPRPAASSPGITRRLIGSPPQDRGLLEDPRDQTGEDAEGQREDRRDRDRDPRHQRAIFVAAPLRAPACTSARSRGGRRTPPRRSRARRSARAASVPGPDRRGEHAHLRDEPHRGRDARQRQQEQRHEPRQERAPLGEPRVRR